MAMTEFKGGYDLKALEAALGDRPYYLELDVIGERSSRMKVMSTDTKQVVAQREGTYRDAESTEERRANSRRVQQDLLEWARSWIRRHGPKQVP
jgi:hypothetical protein